MGAPSHASFNSYYSFKPMREFDRYGRVVVDDIDSHIVEFKEKAHCKEGMINGGIHVISRHNLPLKDMPTQFSFEKDILEPLSKQGRIYGHIQDGYFIDIGIPEDYLQAQKELSNILK